MDAGVETEMTLDIQWERAKEMLEQTFSDIYIKFKVHFYQEIFRKIHARETSLSAVEIFCVEIIHAMKEPTVNEFAKSIQVSSPNAAYKVNSLIRKGYIEKVQSETDKREYHLRVTKKYYDYYNLNQNYLSEVTRRAEEHFTTAEIEKFDEMLNEISKALMPETDHIPPVDLEKAKGSM